jgi:hypothetical protein
MSKRHKRRDGREPSPLSFEQGGEFVKKLRSAGLDDTLAQDVVQSPDNFLGCQVMDLLDAGGVGQATQEEARSIMGMNFISHDDVELFWRDKTGQFAETGCGPDPEDPDILDFIPFPRAFLKKCCQTHILFPGLRLNIIEMQERRASLKFANATFDRPVYGNFFLTRVSRQWYLMKKFADRPLAGSQGTMTAARFDSFFYAEKAGRLPIKRHERLPSIAEAVYALFLWTHFRTKEPLFSDYSTVTSNALLGSSSDVPRRIYVTVDYQSHKPIIKITTYDSDEHNSVQEAFGINTIRVPFSV